MNFVVAGHIVIMSECLDLNIPFFFIQSSVTLEHLCFGDCPSRLALWSKCEDSPIAQMPCRIFGIYW
jgi:hypothetical protein